MSREPEKRTPKPRTVGSAGGASAKNVWFVVGIAAVAISVAVLLTVVARALGGDDGDTPASPDDPTVQATAESTATGEPEASATPGDAATATPTTPATEAPTIVNGFPLIDCLDTMAPADKQHIMSPECEPPDLVSIPDSGEVMRSEAAEALNEMFEAAAEDGHTLLAVSGYRSYQTQEEVYASAVAGYGQEWADRTSARPGHSEHQLGTVMDVSTPSEGGQLEESFGDTPAGQWVAENSWRYGFVISYPEGTEEITGYTFEPWHLRYLGTDTAAEIQTLGITITEYLRTR